MRVSIALAPIVAVALAAAGCGGSSPEPIRGGDAPAVTSPGTAIPYEDGGADGSGGDGRKQQDARGGVAAGPDVGSGS